MEREEAYCQIYDLLQKAMSELGAEPAHGVLSPLVSVVVESYAAPGRNFHSHHHIFDVAQGGNGLQVIAAVFHDLIYLEVDCGMIPGLKGLLNPYLHWVDGSPRLRKKFLLNDLAAQCAVELFAPPAEQNLQSFRGHNEFLSALAVGVLLGSFFPLKLIAQIQLLIESTIPFRKLLKEDWDFNDHIKLKIQLLNQLFNLDIKKTEVNELTQHARWIANSDLRNFASTDPRDFFRNTWRLFPESTPALRSPGHYSVFDYRPALQKMELFLSRIDPGAVFHGEDRTQLKAATERNINLTLCYLRTEILACFLIEQKAQKLSNSPSPLHLQRKKQEPIQNVRQTSPTQVTAHDLALAAECSEYSGALCPTPIATRLLQHLSEAEIHALFEKSKLESFGWNSLSAEIAKDIFDSILGQWPELGYAPLAA